MEGLIIYLLFCIAILGLLCVVGGLIYLRERDQASFSEERREWVAERHNLNNRIMARDWTSYLAVVAAESEAIAVAAEKEENVDNKTTDYEKAWSM